MIKIDSSRCLAMKSKKEKIQCPRKKVGTTDFCGYHKNSITDTNNSNAKRCETPYTYDELKLLDFADISMNRLLLMMKEKHKIMLSKTETITKEQLYKLILTDLEEDVRFNGNIGKIIKIQAFIRGYHIWKRRKTVNVEDFFTLDNKYEIPLAFYHEINQNGFRYCFDIRTLEKIVESSHNKPTNPYTSEPLRDVQILDINRRIDYLKKNGKWGAIIDDGAILSDDQKFAHKMIEIFHAFDMLDNYTDYKWFEELSLLNLKRLYKYARDMWNFRAQIDMNEKKRIVKEGVAFNIPLSSILNMRETKKRHLQHIILDEFRRFATEGVNITERKLGAMLMLTTLVNVSDRAAYALPQYVQM